RRSARAPPSPPAIMDSTRDASCQASQPLFNNASRAAVRFRADSRAFAATLSRGIGGVTGGGLHGRSGAPGAVGYEGSRGQRVVRKGVGVPIQRIMMMTVQVRDFDTSVAWYRDVLGMEILGVEPDEFCLLRAPHGSTTIGLATDHPDRIPERPGGGWTPTFPVDHF